MTTTRFGLFEIEAGAPARLVDATIEVVYPQDATHVVCRINGRSFEAESVAGIAESIDGYFAARADRLLSLGLSARARGSRLLLDVAPTAAAGNGDLALGGAAAERAVAKAENLLAHGLGWDEATTSPDTLQRLDSLDAGWGGPLIVSMPRTGSTLFGTMFLLARNPPGSGEYVFDRYVHEPIAPVFWQGRDVTATAEIVGAGLTARDIVQESAYQFATPDLARWFLTRARSPVVFLIRHPQRAWPSRWRVMLRMMRANPERRDDWPRIDAALQRNDFSEVGDLLTEQVRPADNGWGAFLGAVDLCRTSGIDFTIIDNTRFRDHPEETMREVSRRWGITYDDRLTTWSNLAEVLPRVVMGNMASNDEYEWYYARTLGSENGIIRADDVLLDPGHVPDVLRGESADGLTIDEAATWYRVLLTRPEVMA